MSGVVNNILNVKISNVSSSSSVNFGNTVHIGAESNSKSLGGSSPIGDFANNVDFEKNLYLDPDFADQNNL
jgi:hypothetical protein